MRRFLFVFLVLFLVLLCTCAGAEIIKDFSWTPLDHAVEVSFDSDSYDAVVISYLTSGDKGKMTLKGENGHFSGTVSVPNTYPGNNVVLSFTSTRGLTLRKDVTARTAILEIPVVEQAASGRLSGVTVCVDPGHAGRGVDLYVVEPLGPGISGTHKTTNGQAQGVVTRRYESTVVLEVGMKLRNALLSEGASVVMTREDQETAVTNVRRAEIAAEAGADFFIRLHCDNSGNKDARGIFVYIPLSSANAKAVADAETYFSYGETMLRALQAATGVTKGTVRQNNSYVASNWATMPAFLVEIGFMSNAQDDVLISTPEYQEQLVSGFVDAVEELARIRGIIE